MCWQIAYSNPVKDQLGFKSQPPLKRLFLTTFSKINGLTKIEKLGTWQDSIWFRNSLHFFFVIPGYTRVTPYFPKMASKLMSWYLSSNFHELVWPLVADFKTFPVISKNYDKVKSSWVFNWSLLKNLKASLRQNGSFWLRSVKWSN